MVADAPIIVVEVLSRSNARIDFQRKLAEYFSVTSVRHYLIVDPEKQAVIHHRRLEDGTVSAAVLTSGEIDLLPPGLAIALEELFAPLHR
jgi:Uma2 family endonuclease